MQQLLLTTELMSYAPLDTSTRPQFLQNGCGLCDVRPVKKAMKVYVLLVFLSLLHSFCCRDVRYSGCYKELPPPLPSYVVSEPPTLRDPPEHFDWSSTVTLTPPTNQMLPSACGSCWAHAAVGALTDRIIMAREKASNHTPVVPLSPQVLLDIESKELGTCHGGSALGAYAFIKENGITDITCSPYMGVDNEYWGELPTAETMCRSCDRFGSCKFVNATKQYISEYGSVTGESEMKAEIYARGPVACSVYAHAESFEGYSGGVIKDATQYNSTTHVVAITGWGVTDSGTKYWIGRNSFGTTWGEGGWFKLERGVNTLDIEKHTCAWAVPKL